MNLKIVSCQSNRNLNFMIERVLPWTMIIGTEAVDSSSGCTQVDDVNLLIEDPRRKQTVLTIQSTC